MDLLRKNGCYKKRIRIYRDDPREYTVRWFIVPDTTPWFPTWHIFASGVWNGDHPTPSVGPGELEESPKHWDRGIPPPEPNPCVGLIDWYQHGVPIAALR
jgi:hypothetical protein